MDLSLIKISQKSKQFSFNEISILHLSEEELFQFRNKLNEVVAAASSIYRLKKRQNSKLLCVVCNDSVDKYYYDKHCTMTAHIKKLEEQGLSPPPIEDAVNVFCTVCDKNIKKSYFGKHILTRSHLDKIDSS